jgi:malate dehydrogenase
MQALRGVVMELEDAAYPLLENVYVTSSYEEAFQDSEAVILLGGFPRRPGMERVDLIHKNTSIFRSMGPAINKYARKDVKVVVVANPANTNCLTLIQHCPSIPKENFSALMRLDHNRASALTARSINRKLRKASSKGGRAEGVIEDSSRISASDVSNVIIWGNHSATQYPDLSHAVVTLRSHRPAPAYSILAKEFIEGDFVAQIQTRGAKVIQARKLSSALSAAHATAAHMRDWFFGTAEGTIVSMAVYSDGTHYDVPEGVVFGFPCVCKPNGGGWEIIDDMYIDQFSKEMLDKNINELNDEKAMAASAS